MSRPPFPNEKSFEAEIAAGHQAFPVVPAILIRGVIAQESGYKPDAMRTEPRVGDASRGLMQLLYTTARGLGYQGDAAGLFDPRTNIYYGAKDLAALYGQLKDWDAALSAYNGGIRPGLAFGAKSDRVFTVCLATGPDGKCAQSRVVQPGEFANQPYVDGVKRFMHYFATGTYPAAAGDSPPEATGHTWLVPLALVGVLGVLLLKRGGFV